MKASRAFAEQGASSLDSGNPSPCPQGVRVWVRPILCLVVRGIQAPLGHFLISKTKPTHRRLTGIHVSPRFHMFDVGPPL